MKNKKNILKAIYIIAEAFETSAIDVLDCFVGIVMSEEEAGELKESCLEYDESKEVDKLREERDKDPEHWNKRHKNTPTE